MLQIPFAPIRSTDLQLWKKDRCLGGSMGDIADIALLSLDIFDTLLFRTCANPADVFVQVAGKAHLQGCLQASITAEAFKAMRILAEHEARQKQLARTGFGEVTLELIYAQMPEGSCDKARIALIEVETEAEVCYVNPHVASLLTACQSAGIPVALLSDMYLSADQLRYILNAAGLDLAAVDTILVSSEEQEGKSSGHLFARLKEMYPHMESRRILHIGDNVAADIDGAAKAGIRAIHYNVIPEHFESLQHWEYVRHGDVLPEWKSLRKLAEASDKIDAATEQEQQFYRLGASVIGPFLQSLCDWVLDICAAEGINCVHPLMREAYLLAPMLENAAQLRGIPLQVKPIYVSRQATLLAGMASFGEVELANLVGIHGLGVGELFEVLAIGEESRHFAPYVQQKIEACKQIKGESGDTIYDQLANFLRSEPIQRKIDCSIQRHRELLVSYLKQEFGSPEQLVTIDIGFHGTIQTSLEKIVRLAGMQPQMKHLLAVGASNRLDELSFRGMDIRYMLRAGSGGTAQAKRIARTPAFLEELMMGDFGSTLRYAQDESGKIQPVTAILKRSENELRRKGACQRGAIAFQGYYAYLLNLKRGHLLRSSLQPEEWSKPLHRVLDMPRPLEARILGDLTHQDNFGTEYIAPICEDMAEKWFQQGAESFLNSCNYAPSILNVNWPQGVATRQYPFYLYHYYLRLQDGFGSQGMLFSAIQKMKEAGHKAIHLYGTGSFAEQALKLAWFHGLQIPYWIDPVVGRHAVPWGPFQYTSLEQAKHKGLASEEVSHTFWLATLSDMDSYRQTIIQAYEGSGITPIIYILYP
ncbi:HAD family hydrolase [Paenibacillus alba]|uniref:HAD family hydrolase n=1 Tax=Paenibacillus alba TaxID=1197127 RepID=UPI001563819A|nr:HAD family hydrolase [Paenibacillus alba]NQX67040.1 HAD family hydrolase [Paenibacillus alba]